MLAEEMLIANRIGRGLHVGIDHLRARRAELAGEWTDAERGYTEALRRIQAGEQPERDASARQLGSIADGSVR